jgi:hypothetical protein
MAVAAAIADYKNMLTSTMPNVNNKVNTTWHNDHVALWSLRTFGGYVPYSGGYAIHENIANEEDASVSSRGRWATVPLQDQEILRRAEFEAKIINGAIALNQFDLAENRGKEKVLSLWDTRQDNAMLTMRKELNRQYFQAIGNNNETEGVKLIVAAAPTSGTVGGINRATEATWRNQAITSVGSFATNGVDKFRRMYNLCATGPLSNHTEVIIMDMTGYEAYEKTQVSNQRYDNPRARAMADASFEALAFKNAAVTWDQEITSGYAYFLDYDFMRFRVNDMFDFKVMDPKESDDQFVVSSLFAVFGNFTTNNPRYLGVLTGITA